MKTDEKRTVSTPPPAILLLKLDELQKQMAPLPGIIAAVERLEHANSLKISDEMKK